jgi:predicted Zn-dependent protease
LVVDAALFTNSKIAPDALQQFKQMREGAFLPLLCLGELGKAHSVLRSEANLTLSSAITAEALSALATKRDMGWFPSLVLGQQLHKKDHSKINDLKELIKKDPTNASALSLMGEDYENRGKIKEAWSYYQRALNHNCFCVPAHLGILRIIKVQGNSSVQNEINFAKQCCPNHPQVIALINELSKNKENVGGSLAA